MEAGAPFVNHQILPTSMLVPPRAWSQVEAAGKTAGSREEVEKTASDFEAVFLTFLLRELRKSIPKSSLLGEDAGRDIYEEMMDGALAEEIVKHRGIGLKEMLVKALDRASGEPRGDHSYGSEEQP